MGVGYHYQRADLGKMVKQGTRQEAQASEDICIAIGILDRYGAIGTMMMMMMIMIIMLMVMAIMMMIMMMMMMMMIIVMMMMMMMILMMIMMMILIRIMPPGTPGGS